MAQYLKPDSELGYVEDNVEIESLKFNNLRHVVFGCMLGDFNEVGDYVVSPEIVNELISMEKYIVQTFDNIELCKSTLKLDKQISFMVTFEGNKATLTLIEKINYEANFAINSGTYSNINEFVLDSVETSGEIDHNVIYNRWNIKPYGGQVVDIFNCDDSVLEKFFGIVNRFKYLLEANRIMLEKEEVVEEAEACYVNDVFKVLVHYPKLKEQIENSIKENLKENKDSVSVKKPYFAKTFNEILENAIQKNLSVLNENEKIDFQNEKRNAKLNLNIKHQDLIEIDKFSNKETAPKIVRLKTDLNYENQNLSELGSKLVKADRQVVERINGGDEKPKAFGLIQRTAMAVGEKKGSINEAPNNVTTNKADSERNKLIELLAGMGLIAQNNKKDEKALEITSAETSKEIKKEDNKVQKKPTKGNDNKSEKKAGGKKSKPKPKKDSKTEKTETKTKGTTQEEKKSEIPFRPFHGSGNDEKSENLKKEPDASKETNKKPEGKDVSAKAVRTSILDLIKDAKNDISKSEKVDQSSKDEVGVSQVDGQSKDTLNAEKSNTEESTVFNAKVVVEDIEETLIR